MLPSSKLALLAAVLALTGTTNSTRTQMLRAKHQERALVSTAAGKACKSLSTLVYTSYAPSPNYLLEIQHASSNAADIPTCVVEPETPEQVGQILKSIGQYRAPFAVQSGGHTSNPGFSSTKGVHITLSRFNHVTLSSDGLTADVGSGQSWGDVYKKLEGTGRIVVGGRVSSVGVGGFLAYGGGYSFHSNQYGLGVDLIEEYTLVLPDGTVKSVTSTSDNKLFNALKGSGNNFGIITSFKLKTVPMPSQIWGGQIVYSEDKFSQLSSIIASLSSNNLDPKAAILPSFTAVLADAISLLIVQIFYDGPSPPPGTFDAFTSVQSISKDLKARTFVDFIEATPAGAVNGLRTYFHPIPVKAYTPKLVKAFADMASEYALKGTLQTGAVIAASVEPFTAGAFAASSGLEAFLHDQDHACFPSLIGVNWISPLSDGYWQKAAERIVARLTATAIKEGQDLSDCPYYPNYSLYNTPLEKIYLDNLPALKAYKAEIDPKNVMGLAGGFKL